MARTTCGSSSGNTCATNVALPRASPGVGVRPQPVTCDKPRHAVIVFSVPILCSQMFFFRIFGSHGSSSSVLESLLELTDATVMMNNEPTDTLHRIWQSFPRCLGAT